MLWSWVFGQVGPRLRKSVSAQTLWECWPLTLLTSLWEAREGYEHSACGEDVCNLGPNAGSDRHLDNGPVDHTPVFTPMDGSLMFVCPTNNKLNAHRSLRGGHTWGLLAWRGPCPGGSLPTAPLSARHEGSIWATGDSGSRGAAGQACRTMQASGPRGGHSQQSDGGLTAERREADLWGLHSTRLSLGIGSLPQRHPTPESTTLARRLVVLLGRTTPNHSPSSEAFLASSCARVKLGKGLATEPLPQNSLTTFSIRTQWLPWRLPHPVFQSRWACCWPPAPAVSLLCE